MLKDQNLAAYSTQAQSVALDQFCCFIWLRDPTEFTSWQSSEYKPSIRKHNTARSRQRHAGHISARETRTKRHHLDLICSSQHCVSISQRSAATFAYYHSANRTKVSAKQTWEAPGFSNLLQGRTKKKLSWKNIPRLYLSKIIYLVLYVHKHTATLA